MTSFGHIEQFNPQICSFQQYLERLEFYFIANSIEDENKQKAIFISVIGPQNFNLLRDLTTPSTIQDKSFSELKQLLKDHYQPKPQKFVARTAFENRIRNKTEPISDFVASLRKLSEHCQFGTQIDDRLCEKLVRSVNDEKIQRRLLSEPDLTLNKAVEICQVITASNEGAKGLNEHCYSNTPNLNFVPSPKNCLRCGNDHKGAKCRFINAECFLCHTIGHLAKCCLRNRSTEPKQNISKRQRYPNQSQPQRNNQSQREHTQSF